MEDPPLIKDMLRLGVADIVRWQPLFYWFNPGGRVMIVKSSVIRASVLLSDYLSEKGNRHVGRLH